MINLQINKQDCTSFMLFYKIQNPNIAECLEDNEDEILTN